MFKTFSTITLVGLLTLLAAHAQSNQPIQAAIPFAFTAQDATLAAGNYQLTYSSSAHILSIRGLDRNLGGTFVTALPVTASGGTGKLVFRCYDKSCQLAEISQGARMGGGGLRLPLTGHQRKVAIFARVAWVTVLTK
jgi:hypothetical protein